MKKRCSVCGDTCQTNVTLVWERHIDGQRFDICCLCAEANKVNADSVNNFPSTYDPVRRTGGRDARVSLKAVRKSVNRR